VAAVTALAQLLERSRDLGGRRALLDHAVGLLRHDVDRGELDIETLRALVALLVLRERPRAAAAVDDLVLVLTGSGGNQPLRPGRSLAALRRPELDERSFPPGLPPGIRQIMRLVGPHLRPSGGELAQHLARHGVARADRVGRGQGPRPVFDGVGAELGAGEFDLFIRTATPPASGPIALRAEPGSPAAIIVGAPIVALGTAAVRFAAARALRLTATNLDAILAVPPEEAAALLVGIIRQFVPDFLHPAVRDALVDAEAARAARLIPRKIKPAAAPFAIESAGPVRRGRASRRGARRRERDRPARRGRPAGRAVRHPGGFRDARSGADAVADRRQPGGTGSAAFCGLRRLRRPRRGDGGVGPHRDRFEAVMPVGDPSPPTDDPLIGKVLSERYRIVRKIGEGGMGAVYQAEHALIEKKIALKILFQDLTRRPDLIARFLQEAKSASRIGHENVIDISDFGQSPEGLVFIAMEYLDGQDLGKMLKKTGAMNWDRARPILMQIAKGLRAAHSNGIIHRDMKPENIYLIQREGRPDFVKVLDFGIAKIINADEMGGPALTQTG
jgi:hypothetical protein